MSREVRTAVGFARAGHNAGETGVRYVGCGAGGRDVSGTNPYGKAEVIVLPYTEFVAMTQCFDANRRRYIQARLGVDIQGIGIIVLQGRGPGAEAAERRLGGLLDEEVAERARAVGGTRATARDHHILRLRDCGADAVRAARAGKDGPRYYLCGYSTFLHFPRLEP